MASFNRVILMGNLTRDPRLSYTPNNTAVCEFGLAVNRRFRDRDGNQRDEVCYVDLSAFGRSGETINQYMSKGRAILVEGRLKFDSWTSQEGQKRNKLSVVVENFTFIGGRGEDGGGGGGGGGERGNFEPAGRSADASPPSDYGSPDDGPPQDDDIPF